MVIKQVSAFVPPSRLEFSGGDDHRKAAPALAAGCTMVIKPMKHLILH